MKRLLAVAAMAPLMAFPAVSQDNGAAQMRAAPAAANTQTMDKHISASALLDENVVNANNETIGDINDVLLDRSGKVASVIVGVGGGYSKFRDLPQPDDQLVGDPGGERARGRVGSDRG